MIETSSPSLSDGGQPLEVVDGFAVHVDVDVSVDVARLVPHQSPERGEAGLELVEGFPDIIGLDRHAVLVIGGAAERVGMYTWTAMSSLLDHPPVGSPFESQG